MSLTIIMYCFVTKCISLKRRVSLLLRSAAAKKGAATKKQILKAAKDEFTKRQFNSFSAPMAI
eukprot:5286480-Amphidinium_carterae.1